MSIFTRFLNVFKRTVNDKNPAGMEIYQYGQQDLGYRKNAELLKEMKGWVFACCNAISDEIANIEIKLYKKESLFLNFVVSKF